METDARRLPGGRRRVSAVAPDFLLEASGQIEPFTALLGGARGKKHLYAGVIAVVMYE